MLKTKGGEKTSIQYDAELQTAELLLRTKIAVNQLSIFGAVADFAKILLSEQKVTLQKHGETCCKRVR